MGDDVSLPATPTKKRRIDSPANVNGRAGIATSPRKCTMKARDEDAVMAAFHAAITGPASHAWSPQPIPSLPRLLNTHTTPDDADPSTPPSKASPHPAPFNIHHECRLHGEIICRCHTHPFRSPSFRLCSPSATVLPCVPGSTAVACSGPEG